MGSEEHFEEHHAVARWNTGGRPLAWEIVVGGVVAFTGLAFLYVWVAPFVWYWGLGYSWSCSEGSCPSMTSLSSPPAPRPRSGPALRRRGSL